MRPGVLVVLGACAANTPETGARTELLSELPPDRPADACEVVLAPAELPATDSLVDTVTLTRGVQRIWREREYGPGHVLLSLSYNSRGRNIRLALLEYSTTADAADSVERVVTRTLRSLERPPDSDTEETDPFAVEWGVRLRLDVTAVSVRVRLGRQEYCPPRPRDPRVEHRLARFQADGIRYRHGRRERIVSVNVLVHPAGYVSRATVSSNLPLATTFERRLVNYVKQFSFFPALLDGEPVDGWIEIPVRIPD